MEGLEVECLIYALDTIQILVKYSKDKMEERIPKTLHSVGIIRLIEEIQNHPNAEVYHRAATILNECRMIKNELEHD